MTQDMWSEKYYKCCMKNSLENNNKKVKLVYVSHLRDFTMLLCIINKIF